MDNAVSSSALFILLCPSLTEALVLWREKKKSVFFIPELIHLAVPGISPELSGDFAANCGAETASAGGAENFGDRLHLCGAHSGEQGSLGAQKAPVSFCLA